MRCSAFSPRVRTRVHIHTSGGVSLSRVSEREQERGRGERWGGIFLLTVNARGGVILDTEINVLADTETEGARVGEVLLDKLVLLHLEARLLRDERERER